MHSHLSVICFFKERIELYSTFSKCQLKLSKILTNCVILSASFSSPRQQRRTELYAYQQNQSTPFSKLFLEIQPLPCFNRVFIFLKTLKSPLFASKIQPGSILRPSEILISDGLLRFSIYPIRCRIISKTNLLPI